MSEMKVAARSTPSVREMIRDAREKVQANQKALDKMKRATSPRYGDAPMMAYAKLARAKNTSEVGAAAGYARRQIARLRAAKRQDKENADRIQAAINQLQKAVSRAGKKRRDLEREKLTDARSARAQRENREREAQRLKQEVRRKQAMRLIRESGYIREAEIDNRLQDHLADARIQLRAQAQALSSSLTVSADTAAQQYAAPSAETAPAVVDVQA